MYEFRAAPLEIKALDDNGALEGYASVFGELDDYEDIVEAGAFEETIKAFEARGSKGMPILVEHNPMEKAGAWRELKEDSKGLHVKGTFSATQLGQDTRTLVKEGTFDGLSIGFRTREAKFNDDNDVRHILRLDLYEISLTFSPALASARIEAVKSADLEKISVDDFAEMSDHQIKEELERRFTRNAGLSRSLTRTFIDAGITAVKAKRNAGDGETQRSMMNDIIDEIRNLRN